VEAAVYDLMASALRTSKADYTEIRIEERESSRAVFRGPLLETADLSIDRGGIVRCLVRGGGWGVATFNSLDDLPLRVQQAYEGARAIEGDSIELATVPISVDEVPARLERDFRGVALSDKVALAKGYNEVMRSYDPSIVDTQAVYADSFSRVYFMNSEGTRLMEERPMCTVSLSATARKDGLVQQAFEAVSRAAGYEVALGHEELAGTVARRAVALLSARPVKGGRYAIVCNPKLAGVFCHEAFGHLSEADFVYSNPQAQEMMVLGRRFGRDILNIADDGSVPGLRGSHRYDDEGTPTGKHYLIREGILVGRLHSRETAAKMGEAPTGNARAVSYRYPPIVRMTNTYIEGGQTPVADLFHEVELGIYACDFYGGQTALENFSFTSAYAYMIRNGELAEMVRDVSLAGNLFRTLENTDAIGDDFRWIEAGACGKGGQGGLPVSLGAPHIRIQDVVVGGE